MQEINYTLPNHIALSYFNEIFDDIADKKAINIILNWSSVENIATDAIAFYLCIQQWCISQNIDIQHLCSENICCKRIQSINSIDYLKGGFKQDVYIVPAKDEAETHMIKGIVKQFFENSVEIHKKRLETQSMETLFSELFMNICQHSFDKNGFIFIPAVSESGQIEMIASDLGVGIIHNIKNFHSQAFESDANVIEYATRDWISSHTTPQNKGRGLSIVLTCVQTLKGKLNILSQKGQLRMENSTVSLHNLDKVHKGTFVHISFNISQLDEKEDSDSAYGDY